MTSDCASSVRRYDFIVPYVEDLTNVVDLEVIRGANLSIGADPLGGPVGGAVAARLRDRNPDLSGLRVAFDVGEHEARMLPHCALVETLTEQAGATVRVSRSASDHDRAGWREALLRDVAWALA